MNMTPGNPPSLSYLYQLVFGLYMLVTTVVLINLLIAMMSDTYQRIQVNRNFVSSFHCNLVHTFNSNNLMWNGSLVWPSWSDPCTGQTCLPPPSTWSQPGLSTCSEFAVKVCDIVIDIMTALLMLQWLLGKKAKVEDYSRLQEPSSAKSAGMFKKSKIYKALLLNLFIFSSWEWSYCSWFSYNSSWINF